MQYKEIVDEAGTSLVSVKKANSLIKTIGKESLLANKIFLTALLKVRLCDGKNSTPELKMLKQRTGVDYSTGLVAEIENSTLRGAMNDSSGSYYTAIADIMDPASEKSLIRQWGIVFNNPKSNLIGFVSIITAAAYNKETGKMFIKFSDEEKIQEKIYDLKNGYTMLNYKVMMNLKSVYSYKLYELLLSSIGLVDFKKRAQTDVYVIKFGISELKFRFGVLDAMYSKEVRCAIQNARSADDYEHIEKCVTKERKKAAKFYEFEHRVIKKAVDEINALSDEESDYRITYSFEYGSSTRTPKSILFTVTRRHELVLTSEEERNDVADEPKNTSDVSTLDKQLEIIDEMRNIISERLKSKELLDIAKAANYDLGKVRAAYEIAENSPTEIDNLVGFLKSAIKNGYVAPTSKKGKKKNAWTGINRETEIDYDEIAKKKILKI